MEIKFWIYIIVGVIYLLTRLKKKPEQTQDNVPDFGPKKPVRNIETTATKSPSKALTFEELLREISESKTSTQTPTATASPVQNTRTFPKRIDYDDDLETEEKDLEEVNYDYRKKDKIYDMYDQAKADAFNRPSLEETMKVGDTDVKFGKFKEFELESRRDLMKEYLAGFRDPEGLKKAVVMSEILQRKF